MSVFDKTTSSLGFKIESEGWCELTVVLDDVQT